MTAVLVAVTLLVVLAAAVVALRCAEVSREVDIVTRNWPRENARETERWEADKERRPLHSSEWGRFVGPPPPAVSVDPAEIFPPARGPRPDTEGVGE